MSEIIVQKLYNRLLRFEGKNKKKPYPIHKKLSSEKFGYTDIYKWLAETYKLKPETEVLDAGCGVGYGSIYISKTFNCNVTGISISDGEVLKANEFSKKENLNKKVTFKQQSFDNLQPNNFDFIIAIESIKHTLDINKTIQSLKNALKVNGVLVIVDDFLISEKHCDLLKKYCEDWRLNVLLRHSDFKHQFVLKKDLTPFIKSKSYFTLKIGELMLNILKPFLKVASIMRGGLYLERLFKLDLMKYYILEYRKQ